ncbi:MAG: hypothetical protein OES25_00820 [Acidobacteriota bacterium]|nr:hypothetical protein [Acidobacteriota bacterium]
MNILLVRLAAALTAIFLIGQISTVSAQECLVTTTPNGGGSVLINQDANDAQLNINIASDLSFVRLENSEIKVEYRGTTQASGKREFPIKSWIIKSVAQDQLNPSGTFQYLGAGAGIERILSAMLIYDGEDRKTVRMTWQRWNSGAQAVDSSKKIIRDISIFPNAMHLQVDFIDFQYAINIADLLEPGGVTNGTHIAHGGDQAPRGYITHNESPGVFYSRYAPDGINDPADGGPLNYNGHFITAVYNPNNGRGLGRVMPVQDTHVIKLLLSPSSRRGIEYQNYPFLNPTPVFTGYIYAFTGGSTEALDVGRALADAQLTTGIECGESIEVVAAPYTGWNFTGWSGDAGGANNPLTFTPLVDSTIIGNFSFKPGLYTEDFNGFGADENPTAWSDTAANSSLQLDDSLFATEVDADGTYFATNSTATNIHSHLSTDFGSDYQYTGRMRITSSNGGVGVTFHSQYPNSMSYYRLRRFLSEPFHLTADGGATITSGTKTTNVIPSPNVWYRFLIRVEDTGTQTEIRANVWPDGDPEPTGWQIDAVDASSGRFTSGTIGVWSFTSGAKHFDELAVHSLQATAPSVPVNISVSGNGAVQKSPDLPLYVEGASVQLDAFADPGWRFTSWSGDLASTDDPLTVIANPPSVNVTANFELTTQHPISLTVFGQGSVALIPDMALYDLGTMVTATATADPGWVFDGWTDDITSLDNPLDIVVSGDLNLAATFVEFNGVVEDFESYAAGQNPIGWFDTGAGNSLAESAGLFAVGSDGGNEYLNTNSTATNIHSHLTSLAPPPEGYRYSGRMRMSDSDGGIGITFFSQFPSAVGYYRLRRYFSNTFHISPVGTVISGGVVDTGVVPLANQWYRFIVEVEDAGSQTNIQAKVWPDGGTMPTGWQVDAFDNSPGRFTSGAVGVWSFHDGSKSFDDITIEPLGPPPTDFELDVSIVGSGSVVKDPDLLQYTLNDVVELSATPTAGWQFSGWSGDIGSSDNPLIVVMTADRNLTATFFDPAAEYVENFESYNSGDDPADWQDTASGNSLSVADGYDVVDQGGANKAFRTTSTETNIHSHYTGILPNPTGYEYTGRMRITSAQGGIGITFFSQFGGNAAYYRLRRYFSNSFTISPLGTSVTGDVDTGVIPAPNQWYKFKVQVQDVGSQTEIRAKIWPELDTEPAAWQADCVDASGSRLTSGTVGVWSFHNGEKLWDDLRVIPLP